MVFSKSLQDDCYNMHTIFMSWCSLDLASEKETRESLNQQREREKWVTVLSCLKGIVQSYCHNIVN